ncbi:PAS domain-containing protein [Aestuariispira insulae]|uniref:PAS domain-containing protein n=1 Tax=Aestuariispira insulae TaxID=1461337 RepID=A0A3D9H9G6_9PROT|nr:PAS domain-containing protein [Aestuariispira insulae]RED46133.1 PAS domain-containing protein [Aestuariispira insulae]
MDSYRKAKAGLPHSPFATVLDVCEDNIPCPSMQGLFRYWNDLRGNRLMPVWSEFDPVEVPNVLPDILLYDALNNGDYFVSVVGNSCKNALQIPATPKSLREFMPPENYDDVKGRLDWVRDCEEPHLVSKTMEWREQEEEAIRKTVYTVLFLPFIHGRNDISHKIVNALHFRHDEQEKSEIGISSA